jgi:MSHA biogenesis protein MshN
MSIINKMLKDLDQRQGMATADASGTIAQVRSVPGRGKDREWFWRIIAVLMVAAVGWVAWIAWQLRPHETIATEQALKAALNAPRAQAPEVPATSATPAPTSAPAALPTIVQNAPAPAAPAPVTSASAAPLPVMVAASPAPVGAAVPAPPPAPAPEAASVPQRREVKTQAKPAAAVHAVPPREQSVASSAAVENNKSAKPAARLGLDVAPARILEAPVQSAGRVQKVDRTRVPEDRAETEFRRGAGLLNQGRVSEAEEAFAASLASSPAHEGSRQALVALSLEQRRIDRARQLLQEGLAANPANAQFALVLARIHAERGENTAALALLNSVRDRAQASPDYQFLLGNVLQRLNRQVEAGEAFASSLRAVPSNGSAWVGLGMAFEAQGKRPEAAEAFKRAMAVTAPGSDINNLAEQRLRAVR